MCLVAVVTVMALAVWGGLYTLENPWRTPCRPQARSGMGLPDGEVRQGSRVPQEIVSCVEGVGEAIQHISEDDPSYRMLEDFLRSWGR